MSSENNSIAIIGCFLKDENGLDIIDLDQNMPELWMELAIHRFVSMSISALALFLNLLLLWLVKHKSQRLQAMTPLFAGSAILDICLSITNFILSPLPINAYGYVFGFSNTFLISESDFLNRFCDCINGGLVVSAWNCVPIGFFYRLYVVKKGQRPIRKVLCFFGFITLFICFLCIASAFNVYFFTTDEFKNNAIKILNYMGFIVNKEQILGTSDQITLTIYRKYTVLYGTLLGMFMIICVQIYLHYSMQKQLAKMSTVTKRMNRELNFVMIALGICPLITNLIPAITAPLVLVNCAPMQLFHICRSFILLLPPLLNPLTTILFVQPYRRAVLNSILQIIGQKTSTSVLFVSPIQSLNNSSIKQQNEGKVRRKTII